jgi:phenylacetate-CoA ligase
MDETRLAAFVAALNAAPPTYVLAYVQSMVEVAKYTRRTNTAVRSPGAIVCSAGVLSAAARTLIEDTFGCPVFDRYGTREVGDIAANCQARTHLHLVPSAHYVELLNDDDQPVRPGELGRVIVTSLVNHAMPLLRYEIGDLAQFATQPCACGSPFPALTRVVGRTVDLFRFPGGIVVDGEYFTHMFYDLHDCRKFQVVQETANSVVTRVVTGDPLRFERQIPGLTKAYRAVLPGNVSVRFEIVDHIPDPPSGKHRFTISRVSDQGALAS